MAALDVGTAGNEDEGRPWMNLAGDKEDEMRNMLNGDGFFKQIHHGEENDEGYLVVVVVFTGTRRTDRKSSPVSSPET
jgi:hypothetical protein